MKWKIYATDPPKPKKPYAQTIGWVLAGVMLLFAVAHLVRIDKFVPVIEKITAPGVATWLVVIIVICEVFALPYLLNMRLSPLARVKSGLLAILAPLLWTCLTIWALGNPESTGQFSSYVHLSSGWVIIALNVLWLTANYWFLWLTNFNQVFLSLFTKLRK